MNNKNISKLSNNNFFKVKKQPLISVIVPVYKVENYVSKCIESILNQTYKEFELILINDGSPDDSGMICDSYACKDKRIRVIHRENRGVSETRREGLELSIGQYVTFIDSDDFIDEDYLETLYNALNDSEADIVCCNSIDDTPVSKEIYILKDEYVNVAKTLIQGYFDNKRYATCIWGKLYKKSIFKDVEFPKLKYAEDTFVILSIFKKEPNVQLLKYAGYHYRDNPMGAMNTSKGLQQPLDELICANFAFYICQSYNSEIKKNGNNRLIEFIFTVLMVGSNLSEKEWNIIENHIEKYYYNINSHDFKNTFKGRIVILYKYFPKLIRIMMRLYRKLKYSI